MSTCVRRWLALSWCVACASGCLTLGGYQSASYVAHLTQPPPTLVACTVSEDNGHLSYALAFSMEGESRLWRVDRDDRINPRADLHGHWVPPQQALPPGNIPCAETDWANILRRFPSDGSSALSPPPPPMPISNGDRVHTAWVDRMGNVGWDAPFSVSIPPPEGRDTTDRDRHVGDIQRETLHAPAFLSWGTWLLYGLLVPGLVLADMLFSPCECVAGGVTLVVYAVMYLVIGPMWSKPMT